MFPNNFNTPNAQFNQQNRNTNAYGNAAAPHINYNFDGSGTFDGSGPQLNMQIGNSNANGNVTNDPQALLFKAYQQVHQAVEGQQEAIMRYHELVVKHNAQVSELKDKINELKDELRMAQTDAQTSKLLGTQYIMSYSSLETPFH